MRFLLEKVLESLDFSFFSFCQWLWSNNCRNNSSVRRRRKRIVSINFFFTSISTPLRSDLCTLHRIKLIKYIFVFRYRSPSRSIVPSPSPSLNRTQSRWPDTLLFRWRGQFRSRSKFRYRLPTRSKCPNRTPFHTWNRYRCPWCNLQSWSRSTITAVGQAATPPGKRNQSLFYFPWIRGS